MEVNDKIRVICEKHFSFIAQNAIVFRDIYFQCEVFQYAAYLFAHGELAGCNRFGNLEKRNLVLPFFIVQKGKIPFCRVSVQL